MYIYLEDEDEPLAHSVKVEECEFSCSHTTLPVLPNFDDVSEESTIQLWYILTQYIKFINEISNGHSKLETLPYCVVTKLNQQANVLIDYLSEIGCVKFMPNFLYRNMDPSKLTPICQYVYDACKTSVYDINCYLMDRRLRIQDFKGLKKLFDNQVQL